MNFLQISFSGALIILMILLIRIFAVRRFPKRIFLYLWWIALFRLLIPFSIPSTFGIYSESVSDSAAAIAGRTFKTGNSMTAVSDNIAAASDSIAAISDNTAEIGNIMPFVSAWFFIWCTGAVICTAFFMIAWLRCRFEFQTSLPVSTPFLEHWLKEHPLKRPLSIRQSDKITAPLTYGIFHPVILLPKKMNITDTVQLQHILLHEYVHISHFDLLMKSVSTAALCIHWFNPLVWVMHTFLNRDIELACDESVILHFGKTSRASYAETLLNMETQRNSITPFYSSFNKNAIEERIISIMKMKITTKKNTILFCTFTIALLIFATVFFSTTAAANAEAIADETTSGHSGGDEEDMVIESAADSDYDPDEFLPASKADFKKEGKLLHNYEQFGISYDADGKIYYKGQPVRYFWDGAEIKEDNEVIGWTVRYEYLNQEGTVDVHTIRKTEYNDDNGINLCDPVTGMKQASQKEFDALDIKSLLDPDRTVVAEETVTFDLGSSDAFATADDTAVSATENSDAFATVDDTAVSATENSDASATVNESAVSATESSDSSATTEANGRTLAEIFADYAVYGITYTESVSKDRVISSMYYNGQPVQSFSDTSGDTAFSFSTDTKGLHVKAIRDKNGKLIGVEPVS